MLNYRRAKPEDSRSIAKLWSEYFDHHTSYDESYKRTATSEEEIDRYFAKAVNDSNTFLFIAENDSHIVGFILAEISKKPPCFVDRKYGFISDIAVTQDYRGRGIGKNLLRFAVDWFKSEKINAIETKVLMSNKSSTSFWNKTAFLPTIQIYKFHQS